MHLLHSVTSLDVIRSTCTPPFTPATGRVWGGHRVSRTLGGGLILQNEGLEANTSLKSSVLRPVERSVSCILVKYVWSLRVVFAPPFDGFNSPYRSQHAFTAGWRRVVARLCVMLCVHCVPGGSRRLWYDPTQGVQLCGNFIRDAWEQQDRSARRKHRKRNAGTTSRVPCLWCLMMLIGAMRLTRIG